MRIGTSDFVIVVARGTRVTTEEASQGITPIGSVCFSEGEEDAVNDSSDSSLEFAETSEVVDPRVEEETAQEEEQGWWSGKGENEEVELD